MTAAPRVVVPQLHPDHPPVPRREQLRALLASTRPATGPRPFLLYGQGRTGSTLLGSLLASHPGVTFGDEVLDARVLAPLRYLQGLRVQAGDSCYGVHVKPYHLTDFQGVRDTARWLRRAADAGWLVVHLVRRDTLRHALSGFQLSATGVTHFVEGDGRVTRRIRVDPESLLFWMAARHQGLERERADLVGLDHLTVTYEDDLLGGPPVWGPTTTRLYAALGLPDHPVQSSLRKVNAGRLEDLVVNAEEVLAAVRASFWSHLADSTAGLPVPP
jgi:hypothetical protein